MKKKQKRKLVKLINDWRKTNTSEKYLEQKPTCVWRRVIPLNQSICPFVRLVPVRACPSEPMSIGNAWVLISPSPHLGIWRVTGIKLTNWKQTNSVEYSRWNARLLLDSREEQWHQKRNTTSIVRELMGHKKRQMNHIEREEFVRQMWQSKYRRKSDW